MSGNSVWQRSPTFSNNGNITWFGTLTGRVGVTFTPTAMYLREGRRSRGCTTITT